MLDGDKRIVQKEIENVMAIRVIKQLALIFLRVASLEFLRFLFNPGSFVTSEMITTFPRDLRVVNKPMFTSVCYS